MPAQGTLQRLTQRPDQHQRDKRRAQTVNSEQHCRQRQCDPHGNQRLTQRDFADKQVTEISCHGLGARLLAPETRTVIDIGGQDSKVIQLDAQGNLSDFLMNDKCAAGTGRFLEVISRTLGASVEQLDAITDGVEPHAITSMCTVFAESEVISLRSAGVAPEAILAGVINAMARRSANFIGRLSAQGPLLFTGGVSHCAAFARMLESHVGMAVTTHPDAQFAGAIGAALIGQRQRRRG